MVVEFSQEPKVDGPPPVRDGRKKCASPGKLSTPPFAEVNAEFNRIGDLLPEGFQPRQLVSTEGGTSIATGSQPALTAFVQMLGVTSTMSLSDVPPHDQRRSFNSVDRQLRQVRELDDAIQWLVRDSDQVRNQSFLYKVVPEFENVPWNYRLSFPVKSSDAFVKKTKEYRNAFWDEIIGRLDAPLPPLNPRSRKIYDEPTWTGYEVVLDTGTDGFAWGILCVPKNLKPGEKRPVVVCQHGRNGVPSHSVKDDVPAYQNFAARLAERGFITLAPHNLYRNEESYRLLSRKGNTVKASMFSVILRHHEQWLSWLATQPNVDARRIGFYGLSYGGETAMRVPPLLEGYALSICSGDFNDWTRKVASTRDPRSFMFTDEWEMPYFNMGSTFSYAELSYLMFPRPFMVERGHHDGVSVDSWVASEYAKTRWFYTQFGLPDKTDIEFFNGGHVINGEGTFEFLHKHLNWPKK
jgi:hypothetical protein